MSCAIEVSGVSKVYKSFFGKEKQAVQDLSFSVNSGEAFGFIGPNGAGKSTTIKMVIGSIMPTHGSVLLFGKHVSESEGRRGLGFVPESPYLPDYLSPAEILGIGLRMQGRRADQQQVDSWLQKFGLMDVAKKQLRSFSKGMMQRTALAHALCIQPRLLVLDEPLSGLDPLGRKEVVDILLEYKNSGGTIFFSSHVLHDVERMADRFGLIHQGRMREIGRLDQFMSDEILYTVRSIGDKAVNGMLQVGHSRWIGEVKKIDLWKLLRELDLSAHEIIEVKPQLNLEAVFYDVVRSA